MLGIRYNSFSVYKKSVDARKKNDIKTVITALVTADDGIKFKDSPDVTVFEAQCYPDSRLDGVAPKNKLKPVIIGFGPCGMFCALLLARQGYMPIVFEQGEEIEKRAESVEHYLKFGELNTSSNIQFGEGGAGAFSDGKLITRVNDKRTSFILKTLVEHGAPREILTQAKPHVGTDLLKGVVKSIREEIISLGGEVHFSSKMTDVNALSDGVEIEINGNERIFAPSLFLAIGHSSHDTYKLLMKKGFDVRGKDFSVGVRIEHKREDVEYSLYGKAAFENLLPPAEYSVSLREGDRGVYSFCMCPGGLVMASASDEESIVTNGMSYHNRNEINSNAAIAVSVLSSDYGGSAIGAIEYQRNIERSAWQISRDNRAPAQTVGDFLNSRATLNFGKVEPSYPLGVVGTDLNGLLPHGITALLKKGLRGFAGKHSFFADTSAVLTGVETRTSSPVRIARDERLEAQGFPHVYPCGEGAGWAGGITSAALDGLRVAESYILGDNYVK
ncbi:MAG: hypothetical protein IKL05_06455 [Clostridia bacterium]|nr:hypothetical protein [Clostridia bacterium]